MSRTPENASGSMLSSPVSGFIQPKLVCPCDGGCPRCAPVIQPKLIVGQPDDEYEREADRVAEQVMSMPEPEVNLHRERFEGSGEEGVYHSYLNSRPICNDRISAIPPVVQDVAHSPGKPLEPAIRGEMERRLAYDFSKVSIHTDGKAADSVESLEASAYTFGNTIAFGPGRYEPETEKGRLLIEHELTHVVQHSRLSGHEKASPIQNHLNMSTGGILSRSPKEAPSSPPVASTPVMPGSERGAEITFKASDLLIYPFAAAVWADIKELMKQNLQEFRLKGMESAGCYGILEALVEQTFGWGGGKLEGGLGNAFSTYTDYVEAIGPLVSSENPTWDCIKRIMGRDMDKYFESDRFKQLLKKHILIIPSLLSLLAAEGAIAPSVNLSKEKGELSAALDFRLLVSSLGIIFKKYLQPADFFNIEPLKMKSHPAFSSGSLAGPPPSGPLFERNKGVGEEGSQTTYALPLNMPGLSLWISGDKIIPTPTMALTGRLPTAQHQGGLIAYNKNNAFLMQAGTRYSGSEAETLTSTFAQWGYAYIGSPGSAIRKFGGTVTAIEWNDEDVLAPETATGVPKGGWGVRLEPFTALEFRTPSKRHKIGVGAALSLVFNSDDAYLSFIRGDISWTYLGETGPGNLPKFKLDLSASLHRLDWWNQDSPLLKGLQVTGQVKRIFFGAQVMGGAGDISKKRASQFGKPIPTPTAFLITFGVAF